MTYPEDEPLEPDEPEVPDEPPFPPEEPDEPEEPEEPEEPDEPEEPPRPPELPPPLRFHSCSSIVRSLCSLPEDRSFRATASMALGGDDTAAALT